jgi:hypothetical protein
VININTVERKPSMRLMNYSRLRGKYGSDGSGIIDLQVGGTAVGERLEPVRCQISSLKKVQAGKPPISHVETVEMEVVQWKFVELVQ